MTLAPVISDFIFYLEEKPTCFKNHFFENQLHYRIYSYSEILNKKGFICYLRSTRQCRHFAFHFRELKKSAEKSKMHLFFVGYEILAIKYFAIWIFLGRLLRRLSFQLSCFESKVREKLKMSDFEDKFSALIMNDKVLGALILTEEGVPVRTTFDTDSTRKYANLAVKLVKNTKMLLQESDLGQEVKFFKLTTKKHEMMISPDGKFLLFVILKP